MSTHPCVEIQKDPWMIIEVSIKLNDVSEKSGWKTHTSSISEANITATSLLLSKNKGKDADIFVKLFPMNSIESSDDTVIPKDVSDETVSKRNVWWRWWQYR